MIENVIQPGSEPGSPDYQSDTLTTRPLKKNTLVTWLIIELISSDKLWEKFQYIFCNQDHLTASSCSIIGDARPNLYQRKLISIPLPPYSQEREGT